MDGVVIMNKLILTLLSVSVILFTVQAQSKAENVIPAPASVRTAPSTSIDFAKTYKTSSENLLYLLLSALNENNYSIEEIQFKTGSVLFKAYTKEFIASIASHDATSAFIKIIPADNNYNFSPLLIQKLHKYIEANNNIIFKSIL